MVHQWEILKNANTYFNPQYFCEEDDLVIDPLIVLLLFKIITQANEVAVMDMRKKIDPYQNTTKRKPSAYIFGWWRHQMEIFPPYWPFVWGIHRPAVISPHKSQWRGALKFSLVFASINGWKNNREADDLRRHCAHCDVNVMVYHISGVFCQRHASRAGPDNYIPRYLWDVTTYRCLSYLLLAQHSPFANTTQEAQTECLILWMCCL